MTDRYLTVFITTRPAAECTNPVFNSDETVSAIYDIDLERSESELPSVNENIEDHLNNLLEKYTKD